MDFMTFDFMDFHFICLVCKERTRGLFRLFFSGGFGLFKFFFCLDSEVEHLAAVIIPAFHADGVALVHGAAMAAFRKARLIQRMVRAAIVAVRAGGSHSINHNGDILAYLAFFGKYDTFFRGGALCQPKAERKHQKTNLNVLLVRTRKES
jgi:hypothetical protein